MQDVVETSGECVKAMLSYQTEREPLWVSSTLFSSLFPVNGAVKEEYLNSKTADEISAIIQKLANQSGLEIIRIRKPFHTDNPSIQGQWHPFTNKPSVLNVQILDQQHLQAPQK